MEENKNNSKKVVFWNTPTKIIFGGLVLLLILLIFTRKEEYSIFIILISFSCILFCFIQMFLFLLILGRKLYDKEERKKFCRKQLILIIIHLFVCFISAMIKTEKTVENKVVNIEKKVTEKTVENKKPKKKYETVEYGWQDSFGAGGFFIKYQKEVDSINLEELVQKNFEDHIKITNYETKDIIAISPMYANATISPSRIANIVHSKYKSRNGGYYFADGRNMARIDESYGTVTSFFVKEGECYVYYHKKDGKLEDTYNLIIDSIECINPTVKN